MAAPAFKPGFSLSFVDGVALLAGMGGIGFFAMRNDPLALVVGVVVGHFFLFCNVFRISRGAELIWAAAFLAMAGVTLLTGIPGWPVVIGASIILSSLLIWRQTRLAGYHGICWQKWNPGLPEWWEARHESRR